MKISNLIFETSGVPDQALLSRKEVSKKVPIRPPFAVLAMKAFALNHLVSS